MMLMMCFVLPVAGTFIFYYFCLCPGYLESLVHFCDFFSLITMTTFDVKYYVAYQFICFDFPLIDRFLMEGLAGVLD